MRATVFLSAAAACGCAAMQQPTVTVHHGFPVGQRILQPSTDDVVIAVGATAELDFFDPPERLQGGSGWVDAGEVSAIEILGAQSSKPDVVNVLRARASRVTIEGRRLGWSTLSLSTARGESEVIVHVSEPVNVDLEHDAVDLVPEARRVFLVGGTARFTMVQRDSAGRVVGGWGNMAPVRIDPPGAASTELREGDVEHVDVTVEQAGEITLRPVGGPPVTIEAVESPGEITFGVDALLAPPQTEPLTVLRSGQPQLAVLWVRRADGARVFGIIERARLVALTPETCEVERMERFYSEGVYTIAPTAPGECSLEAYFGDQTTTISLPVD